MIRLLEASFPSCETALHRRNRPALPQIDESCFIEVMEHRSRELIKLLSRPGKVITAPLHIGRTFELAGNLFELEQGLRDSGWAEVAEGLMEKGQMISAGVVDAQGRPVLMLGHDEVKNLSSRLSELLETDVNTTLPDFSTDLKALAAFITECSRAGLCVMRFGF